MRLRLSAVVLSVAIAPGMAVAGDVTTDHDPAYDFSKVKSFATKIETSWGNEIGENRVLSEINAALVAKGWYPLPETHADVVVVLHGAGKTKQTLNTFYSSMSGWGYMGWGGMATATTTASEYVQGTLVADIFDAKSKNLVFRGTATDEISDNPEKNRKKIEKLTDKMFKDFPPGSKKS